MKILVVTHYYSPEYGAPQRRWRQLVREFRAAGHSVVVVTSPPHYPSGRLDPEMREKYGPGKSGWGEYGEYVIRTAYVPHREDIATRTIDHIVAALDGTRRILTTFHPRGYRPDVVISTAPGIPSLFVGRLASTVFGVPCIAEMRDAWPDLVTHMRAQKHEGSRGVDVTTGVDLVTSRSGREKVMTLFGSAIKRAVHDSITHYQRLATQVVTTTEGFARVLEARGIVNPVVIRNGVNLHGIHAAPPRDPHGGPLRVLYFGNKGRAQGLDTLVEAAAIAASRGVPLEVKIVGHGVDHDRLARLATALRAPVDVMERVNPERATEFYEWADTVVVSLRAWEPFEWTVPSKTYEILATGRHITACVHGETAWIVASSGAGDVVQPGDSKALAEHFAGLYEAPETLDRDELGRRWLQQQATSEVTSAQYLAVLQRVVESSQNMEVAMTPTGLAVRVARNVSVTWSEVRRHIADDPALFAVQLMRRAPHKVKWRCGRALSIVGKNVPGARGLDALGTFVHGDRKGLQAALEASPRSRIAAEIAILADRVHAKPKTVSVATEARTLWADGHYSAAITLGENSPLSKDQAIARRYASERRLLQPGYSLVNDELRSEADALTKAGRFEYGGGQSQIHASERVLHILTNSLPHTQSGYTLRSHAILRAQQKAGMSVRAVTRVGYPQLVGKAMARDVDVVDSITYARVLPWTLGPTIEDRLRQQVKALLEHVADFQPTIIHTTTNYQNAVVASAVSELTGIPWVFEVRGLMEQTWAASKHTAEARTAAEKSERYALTAAREAEFVQKADAVITLAETMRSELAHRGANPEKISLVPNSVDTSLFTMRMTASEARRKLGLPHDGFWVGAVSSIVAYEGFDYLVEAVAQLRGAGQDVRLLLVGDGVARPAIEQKIHDLGIADFCVLPGRVAKEQASLHVLALDAVVVPRRETAVTNNVTPLKPVEAMALARPVIASDIPALRELVMPPSGPPAGELFKAEDPESLARAIHVLAETDGLSEALVAGGQEVARTRTWSAAAETYERVYEKARHYLKDREETA